MEEELAANEGDGVDDLPSCCCCCWPLRRRSSPLTGNPASPGPTPTAVVAGGVGSCRLVLLTEEEES